MLFGSRTSGRRRATTLVVFGLSNCCSACPPHSLAPLCGRSTSRRLRSPLRNPRHKGANTMSHRYVEQIIGRILTDEELRHEFLVAPAQVLAALINQGWDLTRLEADGLIRTDVSLWISGAAGLDPRLQRCSLKGFDGKE